MTQSDVQTPWDPAKAEFDFSAWRNLRRLIAAQLRTLATERDEDALLEIAEAFDTEALADGHLAELETFLRRNGCASPSDQNELFIALDGLVRACDADRADPSGLAAVDPDWDKIPLQRAVFVGRVNGVTLRARLPETRGLVPDQRIVWMHQDGSETELALGEEGHPSPGYAETLWDWLFARRLTLLCQGGAGEWPNQDAPPVMLDAGWTVPFRPF